MIPKEIKYNLHYDDVRRDFLRSPQCTTPATVEYNKSQKRIAFGNKEHTKITKIGDSVWLSLFTCNAVVCTKKKNTVFSHAFKRELSRKLRDITQKEASSAVLFLWRTCRGLQASDRPFAPQSICLVFSFLDGDTENYQTICTQGRLCTSLDLKDAYFHIRIHRRSSFLRLVFDGNVFQLRDLPFGLSVSPYVFTRVLKTVLRYIRSGIRDHAYLDDWLQLSASEALSWRHSNRQHYSCSIHEQTGGVGPSLLGLVAT